MTDFAPNGGLVRQARRGDAAPGVLIGCSLATDVDRTPPNVNAVGLVGHPDELRSALVSRAEASRDGQGDQDTRWFACVVALVGWPNRRLVGQDGASAAFTLADRAPLPYRAGWAAKVANAMEAGTVPAQPARNFLAGVQAERVRRPSVAG